VPERCAAEDEIFAHRGLGQSLNKQNREKAAQAVFSLLVAFVRTKALLAKEQLWNRSLDFFDIFPGYEYGISENHSDLLRQSNGFCALRTTFSHDLDANKEERRLQ